MRVFSLINQLAPGGAPTLLLDLVRNAADRDVSFVVCSIEGDRTLVPDLREAGAAVHTVDAGCKFDPRGIARLARLLRDEEFDVLHAHLPYAQTLARVLAPRGVPVVSTQHNVPDNYHPITRALEAATRRLDDATVAVSEGVERAFRGDSHRYDGRLDGGWCTIPNGIDVGRFEAAVHDADPDPVRAEGGAGRSVLFLDVARYVPAKAQADLVAAMERVVAAGADAHLVLVGWGAREGRLRAAVEKRDLGEHVTVTGRVPSVHPYYAAADAFVSSSTFEGLPIAHLEAMAAGLPVVATDIPGVDEVVRDGETGLLVAPGDPDALADAMLELADGDRRRALGRAARRRVEAEFDVGRTVDTHLRLYRSLCEGSPG